MNQWKAKLLARHLPLWRIKQRRKKPSRLSRKRKKQQARQTRQVTHSISRTPTLLSSLLISSPLCLALRRYPRQQQLQTIIRPPKKRRSQSRRQLSQNLDLRLLLILPLSPRRLNPKSMRPSNHPLMASKRGESTRRRRRVAPMWLR